MAKKTTTPKNLDSDVASELEKALDFDLAGGSEGDLDIAASMQDLEAQISQAADELARESRSEKAAAAASTIAPPFFKPAETPVAPSKPAQELRPVDRPAPAQPANLAPANDDRQKDFRSLLHGMNRRASNTVYWVVSVLSLAWLAAAGFLANTLFAPEIWRIRSLPGDDRKITVMSKKAQPSPMTAQISDKRTPDRRISKARGRVIPGESGGH